MLSEYHLYVIESNPTMADYQKVVVPMTKVDATRISCEFPNLIVRLATDAERSSLYVDNECTSELWCEVVRRRE